MSRSFTARPAVAQTTTTPTTPQHTPDPKLDVRCLCGKRTKRLTSRSEKNPGRHFYACYKGFSDAERCKYFKWEDDLIRERNWPATPPPTTSAARTVASMNTRPAVTPTRGGGQGYTLGGSPPGSRPISSIPPPRRPGAAVDSDDSIDDALEEVSPAGWAQIDAIALQSSPMSAKAGGSGREDAFTTSAGGRGSKAFLDKLKGREVEEIEGSTDDDEEKPAKRVKRERSSEDEIVDVDRPGKSPRRGAAHNPSQWEEIKSDPNNPFHAHHAAAFPPTPTTPDRRDVKALGATTSMTDMSATSSARGSDAASFAGHAVLGGVASHIAGLERQVSDQAERIATLEDQLKKQNRQLLAKNKTEDFLRTRLHAAESRARELQGVLDAQSLS